MRRPILTVTALAFVVAVGLAACEDKGPLQKAGEKIDRAAERAGKNIDDAVKDLKK
jgi:predicted small lipoprotein YifL